VAELGDDFFAETPERFRDRLVRRGAVLHEQDELVDALRQLDLLQRLRERVAMAVLIPRLDFLDLVQQPNFMVFSVPRYAVTSF
jgi:hypothetical protein